MTKVYKRLETKLIHAGEPDPRIGGAVIMPIFQSAMFETAGEASYHDVRYIRLNNTPNHVALHQKLAALENFELKGGVGAAEHFLQKTTLATVAPSLGGVETLVTRPATTSHAGMSPEDRQRLGISDSLIRVSVGIEATEELIEDFDHALPA